jgi:hypothetical protein
MSRQPNLKKPTKLTLMLPEDIRLRLDRFLYDPSMGRVPIGAYQAFFVARINEYLSRVGR